MNITSAQNYTRTSIKNRFLTTFIGIVPIICFWLIFIFYRYSEYFLFDILAITVSLIIILIVYFRSKTYTYELYLRTSALYAFRLVAMFLFALFFALSLYYDGSAITDETASQLYENYEPGNYYISSHGRYNIVSYGVWYRMRILEIVTMPSFYIMFAWSIIDRVEDVGWNNAFKRHD